MQLLERSDPVAVKYSSKVKPLKVSGPVERQQHYS